MMATDKKKIAQKNRLINSVRPYYKRINNKKAEVNVLLTEVMTKKQLQNLKKIADEFKVNIQFTIS
jgi:hypothetical protein